MYYFFIGTLTLFCLGFFARFCIYVRNRKRRRELKARLLRCRAAGDFTSLNGGKGGKS